MLASFHEVHSPRTARGPVDCVPATAREKEKPLVKYRGVLFFLQGITLTMW